MLLRTKVVTIVLLSAAVTWGLNRSPHIDAFIQYGNDRRQPMPTDYSAAAAVHPVVGQFGAREYEWSAEREAALRRMIEEEAAIRRIAPVNARIDRVWKAIPGYNGLEVDVEKTVALAKQSVRNISPDTIPFIYHEIEPDLQLEDLGPHPVYKGNPNKPMVSIMINVAWGDEYIPRILQILQEERVHATFFFDGSWLKKNVELAKTIRDQGHEMSNHAYSHKKMSQLGREQSVEEISKTEQLLKDHFHVSNKLFAPPSGDYNDQTVKIARELGLTTVMWTIDTVDWKNPEPSWILNRIRTNLEPGAMILMHPKASSTNALQEMIQEIKRRGFVLGTVSELLSSERVSQVERELNLW